MITFPPRICNLLTTLPQPPWTQPLDWDLGINWDCEKRVFFSAYVKQPDTDISPQHSLNSCFQFHRLPAELQLRLLSCCPVPTLWQLMRTSSMLRIESSKLFWAHPNTFFLLSDTWILGGGHAGRTCHDLLFLRCVHNVEIEFDCLHDTLWPEHEVNDPSRCKELRQGVVEIFWTTLRKRCPRLEKVVFNQKMMSWIDGEGAEIVPECLGLLIRVCPQDIVAEAFIMEEREGRHWNNGTYSNFHMVECRRAHYRPLEGERWEALEPTVDRIAVLVPGRPFRGPVGHFEKNYFLCNRRVLQERAFWPLVIEALDRHHFDNGRKDIFQCPQADCDVVFTKPGEWTRHAATTSHGWVRVEDGLFEILPTELRNIFEAKHNQMEAKRKILDEESTKMFKDWNEEGEKRKEMEREFLQQLENDEDWATGEQAMEHQIWKNFTKVLNPTWNGV